MEVIEERVSPKPQIVRQPLMKGSSKRLSAKSVHLHRVYLVPWFLVVSLPVLAVLYNWFYVEPECWDSSCKRVTLLVSLVVCVATTLATSALVVVNYIYGSEASMARVRLSAVSFVLMCALSTTNLVLALFTFMQKTCYLTQVVPEDRLDGADWMTKLAVRYDIKLAGVLHILVAIFGFTVSMAFAVIKSNYKYIKQINFDYE